MYMCLSRGGMGGGFGLNQSCANKKRMGRVSVFGLQRCGWYLGVGKEMWVVRACLVQDLGGCGGIMSVCVMRLDSLCIWHIHVSVYCDRRMLAHLRCIPLL